MKCDRIYLDLDQYAIGNPSKFLKELEAQHKMDIMTGVLEK